MSQLFTLGGQSFGTSASASVPPMNIQDWFPLGLIGLISLQSKGLSSKGLGIPLLYIGENGGCNPDVPVVSED